MWEAKEVKRVEEEFGTNQEYGSTQEEAKKRIEHYGKNKLADKKKENIFIRFIKQFNDFMIIILIVASIISTVVSKFDGSGDYIDSIIIIAIVVFNAIMGLLQEAKAEKSLEALKTMTAPVAKVKREGKIVTIPGEEVVPGDILFLEAGNYVPADARLIMASNLKVEESSLTGENLPVLKDANIILNNCQGIGDMVNMVFSSTVIVNGHGIAIFTETGMNTKVGKIANMIITDAKHNASRIVNESLLKAEKIEVKAENIENNMKIFKRKLKLILEQQMAVVEEIEVLKLDDN